MLSYHYSTLHGNINKYNINMLRMNGIIYITIMKKWITARREEEWGLG